MTGRFQHEASTAVDLQVVDAEGNEVELIGVTDTHPFWSEDRQAFIPVQELIYEERLSSLEGLSLFVGSITPRDGPELVFNLEVNKEHVYHVTDSGLLVHNMCGPGKQKKPAQGNKAKKPISNVPKKSFKPLKSITKAYRRPSKAGPTQAQRNAVQGKPCVECGKVTLKQIPDHKDPLVVEYYRTGKVNIPKQTRIDAVQPHCPECSNVQGGYLSAFSKAMKLFLNL